MLYVNPSSLHIRLGAVLSCVIIVLAVTGLTMHKDFYAGRIRRDFFFFYTNLSNLIVLIYFALAAPRLYASSALHALIPHTEFAVMMSIMLTCCVFHFVLLPAVYDRVMSMPRTREFRIAFTDNLIVHYLVPLSVLAYWLLCSPGKSTLTLADGISWTVFPTLYVLAVFIRAPLRGVIEEAGCCYPYPFLDIGVLGAGRVARTCLALFLLCAAAGTALIAVFQFLYAFFGAGHTLVLI